MFADWLCTLLVQTTEHAVENIAYHRFQSISVTLLSLEKIGTILLQVSPDQVRIRYQCPLFQKLIILIVVSLQKRFYSRNTYSDYQNLTPFNIEKQ